MYYYKVIIEDYDYFKRFDPMYIFKSSKYELDVTDNIINEIERIFIRMISRIKGFGVTIDYTHGEAAHMGLWRDFPGCVGKIAIYNDFIEPEDLYETHRPLFYDSENRIHYRWGYRMTIKLIDEKDFLKNK